MSTTDSQPLFDASVKKKKKSKSSDADVEDVTNMMAEFGSKKKKSSKSADAAADPSEDAGALAGEFEFKKKKKKSKAPAGTDAFDIALQKAGVEEDSAEATPEPSAGDAAAGGVLSSGEPDPTYDELLSRFFDILRENNPEMAGERNVKHKIPPPEVLRDGNKKTLFANIKAIADRMHRPTEHVIHFLFVELGTSGSVDGAGRLVIKGRFQQKQIEGVLRRYILEYVTCKTCKSINTTLMKENRLYFLVCNSCGSRRSVQSIKAGYQVVTRRSRMKK